MLLAKRRPVAGFRKRLPADAATMPKARGFGARKKVVVAPRTPLRLGAGGTAATGEGAITDAPEALSAPADWANTVDWVGDTGSSVEAPRANGHAPGETSDLPMPAAIPARSPEMRTLN